MAYGYDESRYAGFCSEIQRRAQRGRAERWRAAKSPLLAVNPRRLMPMNVVDQIVAERQKQADNGGCTRTLPTATAVVMVRWFGLALNIWRSCLLPQHQQLCDHRSM